MNRSLYLLRHGKSDWDAGAGSDHERPLNDRGQDAARRIGQFLAQQDQRPHRILTSSATRALQTTEQVIQAGGFECPLEVERRLYMTTVEGALEVLHEQPAGQRLLVVGHEPTTSELCGALIGGGRVRFPTAALARIDFGAPSWRELTFGRGELRWLVVPRLL